MNPASQSSIPPEIHALLGSLRRRIRRYVALTGLGIVCVVCGVLFWFSLGIDAAWFSISLLELPRWVRAGFVLVAGAATLFTFLVYVVLRLSGRFGMKDLALVLERRFPELNDGLITAVEMASDPENEHTELTTSMLNRTVAQAADTSQTLDAHAVFERRPLRRTIIAASTMAASLVVLGVTNAQAVQRWYRAFVRQDDVYWNRETALIARVVVQPGDHVRDFVLARGELVCKHPRGADFSLIIETPNTTRPNGAEWKRPQRVRLDVTRGDGSRSRVYLPPSRDETFRYGIAQLQDSINIHIRGGDYASRRPYRVVVVDPPRVSHVDLECDYPQYTGLNQTDARQLRMHGAQASLPVGTTFRLNVVCNKELAGFRLRSDRFELAGTRSSGTITMLADADNPQREIDFGTATTHDRLQVGKRDFSVQFLLDRIAEGKPRSASVPPPGPIRLEPDSTLNVYLEDTDGIVAASPVRLVINGTPDNPPTIHSELRGIGRTITRKAVIPVAGVVEDDYGIAKARFDFRVNDETAWRARPLRRPPHSRPRRLDLRRAEDELFELFEVLPLDLTVGKKLTLTVYAEDGDNLHGPNAAHGEMHSFTIVSNEELLSILFAREINLRRRFEQIIEELEDIREDLVLQRSRLSDTTDAETDLVRAVAACAATALNGIRKGANETASIEDGFRGIRDEFVNNRVLATEIVERVGTSIVVPLQQIIADDFPEVDRRLGLFKLATDRGSDPSNPIRASVQSLEILLSRMRQILDKMEDLQKIHEIFTFLKGIIDEQQGLIDATKSIEIRRLKERLKGLE